jgi:hypothetical protein
MHAHALCQLQSLFMLALTLNEKECFYLKFGNLLKFISFIVQFFEHLHLKYTLILSSNAPPTLQLFSTTPTALQHCIYSYFALHSQLFSNASTDLWHCSYILILS